MKLTVSKSENCFGAPSTEAITLLIPKTIITIIFAPAIRLQSMKTTLGRSSFKFLCFLGLVLISTQFNTVFGQTSTGTGNWNNSGSWTTPSSVPIATSGLCTTGSSAAGTCNAPVSVGTNLIINQNISISSGVFYITGSPTDAAGGTAYTLTMSTGGAHSATQNILDIKSGTTTLEGAATLRNANLYVRNGATLILGGLSIDTQGESYITVELGGTLIINGNWSDDNTGGLVTVNGYVQINGNYTTSVGNVTVGGSGVFQSTGSMTTTGSSTIFGSTNNCPVGPCSGSSLGGSGCGTGGAAWSALVSPSSQSICSGQPASLTFTTNATSSTTVTYQWESSTTSSTVGFSAITGATSTTLSITPSVNTWYRMAFTAAGCSTIPLRSQSVSVTVKPVPTISNSTPGSRCGTGTVTLGATASAGAVNWYSASTGGTSLGSLPSFTTPSISSSTTYYVDATLNGCTTATRTSVLATVVTTSTWTGAALDGGLWTSTGNWSCGVPTSTTDVTIPSIATQPIIVSPVSAAVRNLTLASGATLGIQFGATISVYGNLSNDGIVNLAGTLLLPSTSGTSTYDADGASGSGILTVVSTLDNQTGSIGPIATGTTFSGNVTVQRYMSAKQNTNRYISMPVTGMTLNNDLSELGLSYGGWTYNETITGPYNNGWQQTTKSYPFSTGKGFLAYMYNSSPLTWSVRGPIGQGNVSLPVTYTPSSPALLNEDGWNLVGNPFPAAIQWNSTDWTSTNIDPVIYVPDIQGNVFMTWDRTGAGTGDLSGGSNGTGGNGMIALGQAFWVKANNTGMALTVRESAKKNLASTFYRTSSQEIPTLNISLSNGSVIDHAYLLIKDKTSSHYDKGIDALKLEGKLMGISLFSDDNRKLVHYSTNELPDKEIPLNVMASEEGNFSIHFESTVGADKFQGLYLLDRYTNTVYPIASDKPYEFAVTANVLTKEGRFFLSKKVSMEEMTEVKVSMFPNPVGEKLNIEINTRANVPVTIYQTSGNSILETTLESSLGIARGTIDVKELPTGLYFIKTVVDGQIRVDKVIKR